MISDDDLLDIVFEGLADDYITVCKNQSQLMAVAW